MLIFSDSKLKLLFLLITSIAIAHFAHAQQESNLIEISGRVTSQDNKDPLPNVSVNIKGTVAGTITNSQGQFKYAQGLNSLLHLYSHP